MGRPDPGPLLDEHLDELQLIVEAGERGGQFEPGATLPDGTLIDEAMALGYVFGWHDRHDRKLLEAARWALANGWQRQTP